jgi:hypothetical protein
MGIYLDSRKLQDSDPIAIHKINDFNVNGGLLWGGSTAGSSAKRYEQCSFMHI